MTPEVTAHLMRAKVGLDEARMVAALPLAHLAARSAYLAAFHAAEALILARTGKVAKTHAGVHAEFARLTRDMPAADGELRRVLGRGYAYKDLADYVIGPARIVGDADAAAMIADAARFVARVTELLPHRRPKPADPFPTASGLPKTARLVNAVRRPAPATARKLSLTKPPDRRPRRGRLFHSFPVRRV